MLDKFNDLLNHLNTEFFSKKMKDSEEILLRVEMLLGKVDFNSKINSQIMHPAVDSEDNIDWNSLEDDTWQRAMDRRIACDSVQWVKHGDKSVPRSNHGVLHTIRSMAYVPHVVDYYQKNGTQALKDELKDISPTDINKMMLVMAFSSIARESEIDFSQQPGAHRYYREKAGEIFRDYYLNRKSFDTSIKDLFDLFESPKEFDRYHDILIAMGDDNNIDPIHIVINSCHKLDLYRCRRAFSAEKSVEDYIRRFTEPGFENRYVLKSLIDFAIDCLKSTGDQVKSRGIKYEEKTFVELSHDPAAAIEMITSLKPKEIRKIDPNNELASPFLFKTIRADEGDFWEDFIEGITRTDVNAYHLSLRTPYSKGAYTVKPVSINNNGEIKYEVVERYSDASTSLYSRSEKAGTSSHQSTTYAHPAGNYQPPPFGFNRGRKEILVGVRYNIEDALLNRIVLHDTGTVHRPYDHFTRKSAQNYLETNKMVKSLAEIEMQGSSNNYNEVLARLNHHVHSICIFSDNLESRLLAQLRAKMLDARLTEMYQELGENKKPSPTKISFYTPGTDNNLTYYNDVEQKADLQRAAQQKDANLKISELLEQLENFDKEHQTLIERYQITDLQIACAMGDLERVKSIVSKHPDQLNQLNRLGRSALDYAAKNGRLDCVKYLIQQPKIDVDISSVLSAIRGKHHSIVTEFLKDDIIDKFIAKLDDLALHELHYMLNHMQIQHIERLKGRLPYGVKVENINKLYELFYRMIIELTHEDIEDTLNKIHVHGLSTLVEKYDEITDQLSAIDYSHDRRQAIVKLLAENLQFDKTKDLQEFLLHFRITPNYSPEQYEDLFIKILESQPNYNYKNFSSSLLSDEMIDYYVHLHDEFGSPHFVRLASRLNRTDKLKFIDKLTSHPEHKPYKFCLSDLKNLYAGLEIDKEYESFCKLVDIQSSFEDDEQILDLFNETQKVKLYSNINLHDKLLSCKRCFDIKEILQPLSSEHKLRELEALLPEIDEDVFEKSRWHDLEFFLKIFPGERRLIALKERLPEKLVKRAILHKLNDERLPLKSYSVPYLLELFPQEQRMEVHKLLCSIPEFRDKVNKCISGYTDIPKYLSIFPPKDQLILLKKFFDSDVIYDKCLENSGFDLHYSYEMFTKAFPLSILDEVIQIIPIERPKIIVTHDKNSIDILAKSKLGSIVKSADTASVNYQHTETEKEPTPESEDIEQDNSSQPKPHT